MFLCCLRQLPPSLGVCLYAFLSLHAFTFWRHTSQRFFFFFYGRQGALLWTPQVEKLENLDTFRLAWWWRSLQFAGNYNPGGETVYKCSTRGADVLLWHALYNVELIEHHTVGCLENCSTLQIGTGEVFAHSLLSRVIRALTGPNNACYANPFILVISKDVSLCVSQINNLKCSKRTLSLHSRKEVCKKKF